ncbi:hypothetical protein D3C85_1076460 [compost metagenome]
MFGGDHPQLWCPAVHRVQLPVRVREDGVTGATPFSAPGVLDQKTVFVVADNHKGMPTIVGFGLLAGDTPVVAPMRRRRSERHGLAGGDAPAGMTGSAGVEYAQIIERYVHVTDR